MVTVVVDEFRINSSWPRLGGARAAAIVSAITSHVRARYSKSDQVIILLKSLHSSSSGTALIQI